jgi:hypothetical protein
MGRIRNQTDHILVDSRRHSSVLDIRSFRAADCDTVHYLVMVKFRERLSVNKKIAEILHRKVKFKKLNELEGKEKYRIEVSNRFAALEGLDAEVEINSAWETIMEIIKIYQPKRVYVNLS